MKTIYKYQLEITDVQSIEMPKDAEILCVQIQNEIPCLWVKVEDKNPLQKKHIAIVGTGNPMPENPMNYIGTFQVDFFVFHAFELI